MITDKMILFDVTLKEGGKVYTMRKEVNDPMKLRNILVLALPQGSDQHFPVLGTPHTDRIDPAVRGSKAEVP